VFSTRKEKEKASLRGLLLFLTSERNHSGELHTLRALVHLLADLPCDDGGSRDDDKPDDDVSSLVLHDFLLCRGFILVHVIYAKKERNLRRDSSFYYLAGSVWGFSLLRQFRQAAVARFRPSLMTTNPRIAAPAMASPFAASDESCSDI
jgi:hypothetical protein